MKPVVAFLVFSHLHSVLYPNKCQTTNSMEDIRICPEVLWLGVKWKTKSLICRVCMALLKEKDVTNVKVRHHRGNASELASRPYCDSSRQGCHSLALIEGGCLASWLLLWMWKMLAMLRLKEKSGVNTSNMLVVLPTDSTRWPWTAGLWIISHRIS